MTKKHKIRKSKHILENKKGVDENVENILQMIGENEPAENEPDDSGNNFKKSKLSSLVKGFHEDYQYLHKHYKQLISKLENVGHSSTGSDSSDSDSEGDISDNDVPKPKVDAFNEENGWEQKLDEVHQGEEQIVEAEIEKLKQDTVEQANEISELKQLLEEAIKDKEATEVKLSSDVANLSSENENLKSLVETSEREAGESLKTLTLMENETRTLSSEKQIIEKERDDLKISIVDLENKREDLRNQLQDTVEKCTFLSSQLEKAQLAEKEVQTLLAENQKMKKENSMLSVEYDNLKATLSETKAENESLIGENHSLESKLQLLGLAIDGMTVEKEELMNNHKKERGAAAAEEERLATEHSKCLNELEKAQSIVKELENELESTKVTMNDNIAELQNEKNFATLELKQLEASLKNLENELEQQLERISVMQKNNEDLELANSNLHIELAAAQEQKNEAVACTINLASKLEQQNQQISNLQETIEDLKAANTDMYNEVTVHQEEKNAALVQLQQSETYLKNLQSEMEQQQSRISVLRQANEELQEKNSRLNKQLEEVKTNMREEIVVLLGEKEQTLDNLQQSNTSVKTLEGELVQQREKNHILQLANEDLQKSNSNLKKQLEDVMVSLHAEISALQEEKNEALSKLQRSEASIRNLAIEFEQGKEQISILQLANEDMKNSKASLDRQLKESRTILHAEIVALREEKDTTLSELQRSHASIWNFERELEKQSESISALEQANNVLQKHNCTLTEQFEEVKAELQKEIEVIREEKDKALTQLKQSEFSIKNLESEIAQLKEDLSVQLENNSSLDKQVEEAILKVSKLHEKLEKVQAKAASQINNMNTNARDLEETIGILSSQKTKMEEDLKIMIKTCTENVSFMKEFEDRVKEKITNHETGLACLQQSLRGILNSCQRLQHAYDEVSTRASQLEVLKKNQIEQIDQLEEKNKESLHKYRHLEEEKLYANNENTKLQKHVQEIEVQLQLSKQKLKVTEAESKCKEDSYMIAVETSHSEIRHLEQQIQRFSARISLLEETLMQIREKADSGVSKLGNQLHELESHLSQSFNHFTARVSACSEELKLLKNKLHEHLNEQKELLKEKDELAIRLREKEKMVSDMVIRAAESEEKMVQLEKIIEEKEEELAGRVQEKREAIKQLSDAIVYHKNNSDDLIRYIRSHNRPRLPFCL